MKNIKRIHLESTDSTNNYIKTVDLSDGPVVVTADTQTSGRGTVGRSFFSPKGSGLYMTIGFKPEGLTFDQVMSVTRMTGVALKRVLSQFSTHEPVIKPINDIYIDGKKVAGILTESTTKAINEFESIYVGIGINCFESALPEEIKNIAGYIEFPAFDFTVDMLAEEILKEFFSLLECFDVESIIKEYEDGIGVEFR